jgi:hypothetical protein
MPSRSSIKVNPLMFFSILFMAKNNSQNDEEPAHP